MATNIKTINSGSNRITSNLNRLDSYNTANSNKFESKIKGYYDETINNKKWATIFGIGEPIGNLVGAGIGAIATAGQGGVGAVSGWDIGGKIGKAVGAIGQGIFGIRATQSEYNAQITEAEYQKYQNYYNALTTNMAYYGTALENRDEIIFNARERINSSITQMSNTYGAEFTNALRSVFYGKNGIDASVKSLFTGNYNTFNELGSGTVAGWLEGELYDTSELTNDANNYFYNNYTDLELSDLNQKITNRLYNLLMGGGTSFAEQVRGYETEVRDLISNSLFNRRNIIQQYANQLGQLASSKQASDISTVFAIGQAQANASLSGIRGVSASNNVNIQKMQQDMQNMEYDTQVAYGVSMMKNSIENIQMSVSQGIASARFNEQQALKQATDSAITALKQECQKEVLMSS